VPKWFWVIASLALLWFLMDMSAFFMRTFMLEEMLKDMSDQQQSLYMNMPSWITIVFAAEVFGGVLASICLLLKKRFALFLYCISIVGVLLQTCYVYFLSEAVNVMGMSAIIMPIVAMLIGACMVVFTRSAISRSWIT
jgi:hypothetical protein